MGGAPSLLEQNLGIRPIMSAASHWLGTIYKEGWEM